MNIRIITVALSSLLFAFSSSYAEEEQKAENKLPAVITKYIEKILPRFKITNVQLEDTDIQYNNRRQRFF